MDSKAKFLVPGLKGQTQEDQDLQLYIFSFLGLKEGGNLLRSLNKAALHASKRLVTVVEDRGRIRQGGGRYKYEVNCGGQIKAMQEKLVQKKQSSIEVAIDLRIGYQDLYQEQKQLNDLVQLLNGLQGLRHLSLDGSGIGSSEKIAESFLGLKMSAFPNQLVSLTYSELDFDDQKQALMLERVLEVQSNLQVLRFQECMIYKHALHSLIRYLHGHFGSSSLQELYFTSIEFEWKLEKEGAERNAQKELALAILNQPNMQVVEIKQNRLIEDFVSELLQSSGSGGKAVTSKGEKSLMETQTGTIDQQEDMFDGMLSNFSRGDEEDGEGFRSGMGYSEMNKGSVRRKLASIAIKDKKGGNREEKGEEGKLEGQVRATLKRIAIVHCEINDDDLAILKPAFEKVQGLEELEMYGNLIADEGMNLLGKLFLNKNFASLRYLGLRNNSIQNEGFFQFLLSLNTSKEALSLQHLNIYSNYVDMEFESPLLKIVLQKGLLGELDIVGSPSLCVGGLLNLDEVFSETAYPQSDSLNLLFADGVIREETQVLTRFMRNNARLRQLILYEYTMDEGIASSFHYDIFSNAEICSKLQNLTLFFTRMSDESVELLTDFMNSDPAAWAQLKILDLRGNLITNQGAEMIASALQNAYKEEGAMRLKNLNLASNPIKVQGFVKLFQMLALAPKNEGITTLNLSDLDVDKILPEKLGETFVQIGMLRKVDLGYNGIKPGSGLFFRYILLNHPSLAKLDIGGNELGPKDLLQIKEGLEKNKMLRRVTLVDNTCCLEGGSELASMHELRQSQFKMRILL